MIGPVGPGDNRARPDGYTPARTCRTHARPATSMDTPAASTAAANSPAPAMIAAVQMSQPLAGSAASNTASMGMVTMASHAATFWLGVLGFLKAIVWPAMLVFEVLKYLNL